MEAPFLVMDDVVRGRTAPHTWRGTQHNAGNPGFHGHDGHDKLKKNGRRQGGDSPQRPVSAARRDAEEPNGLLMMIRMQAGPDGVERRGEERSGRYGSSEGD